jgi:hypothetical protein
MLRAYSDLNLHIRSNNRPAIQKAIADDAPFAGMLRWYLKREHPTVLDEAMKNF